MLLLRQMAANGLRPNVFCYNSAIAACGRGERVEEALGLLREMEPKVCSAMIWGCVRRLCRAMFGEGCA